MIKTVKINSLYSLEQSTPMYASLDDSYVVCRIDRDASSIHMDPVRFEGVCLGLVSEGSFEGEIDFKPFAVTRNTLVVVGGNRTFKLNRTEGSNVVCDLLFISVPFLQDLNFDLRSINIQEMLEEDSRTTVGMLSDSEYQTIRRFYDLLYHNAKDNRDKLFAKNIGRALIVALVYQMMQIRFSHKERSAEDAPSSRNRQISYVHEFMKLLQLHHTSERSITFYADRLFISPKYLSHLVKDTTGRSASDWVAQFVILEAKNQLRFSNKSIQQVAYALNFSSQSSFGKYFKHITGLSPSEYKKGS